MFLYVIYDATTDDQIGASWYRFTSNFSELGLLMVTGTQVVFSFEDMIGHGMGDS